MSNRQTLALNIPAPSSSLRVQYPPPVRLSLHLRTSSPIPAVGTKRRLSRRSRSCSCGPTARCPGGRFASDILRENPAANGVKKPLFVSRPAKVGCASMHGSAKGASRQFFFQQASKPPASKRRDPRHAVRRFPLTGFGVQYRNTERNSELAAAPDPAAAAAAAAAAALLRCPLG